MANLSLARHGVLTNFSLSEVEKANSSEGMVITHLFYYVQLYLASRITNRDVKVRVTSSHVSEHTGNQLVDTRGIAGVLPRASGIIYYVW